MKAKINPASKPFYLRQFKAIAVALLVAIAAPGYFFLIKPAYSLYQQQQQLLGQLTDQQQREADRIIQNEKIIQVYQSISASNQQKINQILPDDADEANLYVNLEQIVSSAGLVLDSISVSEVDLEKQPVRKKKSDKEPADTSFVVPLAEGLRLVNIDLELSQASYLKVKKIIGFLEKNLRLFDLYSFNFDATEGNLSLSLRAYYAPA